MHAPWNIDNILKPSINTNLLLLSQLIIPLLLNQFLSPSVQEINT